MNCASYGQQLSPYIDGILSSDECRQLETHLEECARCRGELASLQQMLQTLRAMEPPTVPKLLPGVHARLQRAPWWRLAWQHVTAPWPASLPWHGLALATSTALVLLLVVAPSYRVRRIARAEKQLARTNKTFQLAQAPAQASQWRDRRQAGRSDAPSGPTASTLQVVAAGSVDRALASFGSKQPVVGTTDTGKDRMSAKIEANDSSSARAPASEFGVLAMAELDAAPRTEAKDAKTSSASPMLLQVQWRIADLQAAAAQAIEWIQAKHGLVVATNEHHLSIQLPSAEVPEFLQKFSTQPPEWTAPAEPLWITISLELIPSE